MTDFQGALEQALYDRLKAGVTLGQVFQHVPDAVPPPVVMIGDVVFDNDGDKDAPLFRFSVTLVSVVAGASRKPLGALQAQVFAALHDWTPATTAEVRFGTVSIEGASGREVQVPNGTVYFGHQTATIYVQAAG